MNWNRFPFQVKIMGHEPESRCDSCIFSAVKIGCLVSFWIKAVGPGDAHSVGFFVPAETERERHALINPFLVARARFHFDRRSRSQLQVLHSRDGDAHPVVLGVGLVFVDMQTAIRRDGCEIRAPMAGEIGCHHGLAEDDALRPVLRFELSLPLVSIDLAHAGEIQDSAIFQIREYRGPFAHQVLARHENSLAVLDKGHAWSQGHGKVRESIVVEVVRHDI